MTYIPFPPPTHDSPIAKAFRVGHPGAGYCGRCGMPWMLVETHTTNYTRTSGCFPLCEKCWKILGHPEARIPYYRTLIEYWEVTGSEISQDTKNDIARAVANEPITISSEAST